MLAYGGDGGDDGVHRVWSLLDIMDEFNVFDLTELLERMLLLETDFIKYGEVVGAEPEEGEINTALSILTEAQKYCESVNFQDAHEIITRTVFGFDFRKRDYSGMSTELRYAREAIGDELAKNTFAVVDTKRVPCPGYTELLGMKVIEAFPHTIEDIMEASSCLIADCNTAAVFHLMRVVEWGLRALCVHLGLRRVRRHTKTGRMKYTPISYTDWETMLNQLQDKVDSKINKMKRGKRKQAAQEFYYPVLQDIRGIRDAWRNHVMHTRAIYIKEEADAILAHVKRLMALLALKLSEVKEQ